MTERKCYVPVSLKTHRSSDGTWGVEFSITSGLGFNQKVEVERTLASLIAALEKANKEEKSKNQ